MDGEEAARFIARAKELRELATTMKNEKHRQLLLESAENFERLASEVAPERGPPRVS